MADYSQLSGCSDEVARLAAEEVGGMESNPPKPVEPVAPRDIPTSREKSNARKPLEKEAHDQKRPKTDGGDASSSTAKPETAKPEEPREGPSSAAHPEAKRPRQASPQSDVDSDAQDPLDDLLLAHKDDAKFVETLPKALELANLIHKQCSDGDYPVQLVCEAVTETIRSELLDGGSKLILLKRYCCTYGEVEPDPEVLFVDADLECEPPLTTLLTEATKMKKDDVVKVHATRFTRARKLESRSPRAPCLPRPLSSPALSAFRFRDAQIAHLLIGQGCRLWHKIGQQPSALERFASTVEELGLKGMERAASPKSDSDESGPEERPIETSAQKTIRESMRQSTSRIRFKKMQVQ